MSTPHAAFLFFRQKYIFSKVKLIQESKIKIVIWANWNMTVATSLDTSNNYEDQDSDSGMNILIIWLKKLHVTRPFSSFTFIIKIDNKQYLLTPILLKSFVYIHVCTYIHDIHTCTLGLIFLFNLLMFIPESWDS